MHTAGLSIPQGKDHASVKHLVSLYSPSLFFFREGQINQLEKSIICGSQLEPISPSKFLHLLTADSLLPSPLRWWESVT